MNNAAESRRLAPDPDSNPADACDARSCKRRGVTYAAFAESLWIVPFALLPFAATRLDHIYADFGVVLPTATEALLRFGTAIHPSSNPLGYVACVIGAGAVGSAIVVANVLGSAQINRAARVAAIVMLVLGIVTSLAVAAILCGPYLSMQHSLANGAHR